MRQRDKVRLISYKNEKNQQIKKPYVKTHIKLCGVGMHCKTTWLKIRGKKLCIIYNIPTITG